MVQQNAFEAKEVALGKLFDNDYLFRMPVYQRPYAWRSDQTEELLNDLLGAMKDETTAAEPYFLGSIVLISRSRAGSREHDVIDGQQRLTTLTMLFCVLRELTDDDEKRNSLDDRIRERQDVFAGRRDRFRLEIREQDQEFFHDNVQEPGNLADFVKRSGERATDSRRLILESFSLLHERLSELTVEERDALSKFLITRCYLVVVSAYNRESAHRIFSVLNARGLDLTPTDILKSDVIGEIPAKDETRYAALWEATEDELGREKFRELFAHIFVIETGNRFHRELAKAFKEEVLSIINGAEFVNETLMPYSEAFQVVTSATYASSVHAEDVNRMLNHLRELDNDDWIPAAMVFYDKHKADPETLLKLLTELDRLAYAMLIMATRRDPRIVRYRPMLMSALNGESGLDKTIERLQLSDVERRRVVEALNEPIYRPRPAARFARPLLLRLDGVLSKASGAVYDYRIVTVEHVLPQSPDDESEWTQAFTEDEREYWTHRLANLVLLARGKNARAQNYGFDRKKVEYFQRGGVSNFALTTQVVGEPKWTTRTLAQRQKELIDLLKAEWRLE